MVITNVRVDLPIGEATYPRCAADVFEADTLTITSIDDGRVIREYYAGEWELATAYDEQGYPAYTHRAPVAEERAVIARGRLAEFVRSHEVRP